MPITTLNPETIANQRLATLKRFNILKIKIGAAKAAAAVGASKATIWRWQQAYTAKGITGLKTAFDRCGRPSPIAGIKFPRKALELVESLIIETGSPWKAWRRFAANPLCPPAIATLIRKSERLPVCLASLVRVRPVPARCYISADGRRVFVKIPSQAK